MAPSSPAPTFLLGLLLSTPVAAQTVVGEAVDAATRQGVVDVSVTLLDAATLAVVGSARTDSLGRYLLPAPVPGRYLLAMERTGYAAQLSTPVTLRAGELHEHRLRLESLTLAQLRDGLLDPSAYPSSGSLERGCAAASPGGGTLAGVVTDPESGAPLAGVWAEAEWSPPAPGTGPADSARAGAPTVEGGVYVLCHLPPGTVIRVRATGVGRAGPWRTVQVPSGATGRLDLSLPLSRSDGPAGILGRVTDQVTGRGVEAVEVRLEDTSVRALTDANGHFVLRGVPPGRHHLRTSHVAYGRRGFALRVLPGVGHQLRIAVSQEAIALEPIEVVVRSTRWFRDMEGFQERMRSGLGHFFTAEDLGRRAPWSLMDVLRGVPGFAVDAGRRGPPEVRYRGRRCDPTVWVDRARRGGAEALRELRGREMEAVEVYGGPVDIPADFVAGPNCAALVVWTRSGWS